MALHTAPGCFVPTNKNFETGNPGSGDCGANDGHSGCAIYDSDSWSYGRGFNSNGGGVWAMQWESSDLPSTKDALIHNFPTTIKLSSTTLFVETGLGMFILGARVLARTLSGIIPLLSKRHIGSSTT
eukprot:Phypoly_transcript_24565.p1 GENE.Phypoly_transcript_24565~~Phypoly_transcript_24565.p1  ORF type:complete len:127 (+),score=12.33 Phypoly_transcript_24565:88-468(+)